MFLISFVLFGKDLFQPLCLRFCNQHSRRRIVVSYEELFAANVTPEGSHFLQAFYLLSTILLYHDRFHPVLFLVPHVESRRPIQLSALLTKASELWFLRIAVWPHFWQANQPPWRRNMGRR
jgi:hypothetical protein